MLRRLGIVAVGGYALCVLAVSCATDDAPPEDPLTPTVTRAIYGKMVGTINPSLNLLRRYSQEGDFSEIPERASRLHDGALELAEMVNGISNIDASEQRWMVDMYRTLGEQAQEVSEAATDGDRDRLIRLIQKVRTETCNGCHNRYGYRPVL